MYIELQGTTEVLYCSTQRHRDADIQISMEIQAFMTPWDTDLEGITGGETERHSAPKLWASSLRRGTGANTFRHHQNHIHHCHTQAITLSSYHRWEFNLWSPISRSLSLSSVVKSSTSSQSSSSYSTPSYLVSSLSSPLSALTHHHHQCHCKIALKV